MKQVLLFLLLIGCALCHAAQVERLGTSITIRPDKGEARVVRLQVVGDGIIRVQATSEAQLPVKQQSLIIVEQKGKPKFAVEEDAACVKMKAAKVTAVVSKLDGRIWFYDATGKMLLQEAEQGKTFEEFQVPEREIDSGQPTEEQKHGLTWRMLFDSPADEAFYGLGQHQSEELNMKGKNEDLSQYNTKVSVPFVVSNKNYGILWDSYAYCRFGNPHDYLQLNRAFRLYDKEGKEGHLTGTYTERGGKQLVHQQNKQSANNP